jgi:hypothetical protein
VPAAVHPAKSGGVIARDVGCGLQFGATPSPIWKLISREQTHDQTH